QSSPLFPYTSLFRSFDIPVDERSLASIRTSDLQTFAGLVGRMDGVMPAHIIYSQVDEQPAGFSRFWLQQVLRAELVFKGVIFSEDRKSTRLNSSHVS